MKTKAELLAHYAEKAPHRFFQYDGFGPKSFDDVVRDCGEGFALFSGDTYELMSGGPGVRVLIVPGTNPELVDKVLKRVAASYPSDCCNDTADDNRHEWLEAFERLSPGRRRQLLDWLDSELFPPQATA